MSDDQPKNEEPVKAPEPTTAATTEESTEVAVSTEKELIQEDINAKPKTKAEEERQKAFEYYAHDKHDSTEEMKVKVYSPSRVYFNGNAFSVTATNDTGEFDILPKHHHFITLLNECDLIIRTVGEGNRKITISGGLLHVKADEVVIFLDI